MPPLRSQNTKTFWILRRWKCWQKPTHKPYDNIQYLVVDGRINVWTAVTRTRWMVSDTHCL